MAVYLQLIGNLDELLAARGRVRQVDLHPHSEKVGCITYTSHRPHTYRDIWSLLFT